ncbi:MAG: hypothetical protein V7752_05410 [Halopseudomonas sp.]
METDLIYNPGDIIEQAGECFQVLENHGIYGTVRSFPSEEESGFELEWVTDGVACRRIGTAGLPAPSPCSTGGSCPTYEIKPEGSNETNIIAKG